MKQAKPRKGEIIAGYHNYTLISPNGWILLYSEPIYQYPMKFSIL